MTEHVPEAESLDITPEIVTPFYGLQVPCAKSDLKGVAVDEAPASSVKRNEPVSKSALISE